MNQSERLEIQLRNVIKWAKKLRENLDPVFDPTHGKVHFRPSSSGLSLISLEPGSPQRGKSGFTNLERLRDDFDALYAKHCAGQKPDRRTREKELQSFLISESYRSHRKLASINQACMQAGRPSTLLFATDEISLPLGPKSHLVCDLLALRQVGKDQYAPVVMELKSSRMFKKLVGQVGKYAKKVDEHWELFEELFSALLDRDIKLSGHCERWIVWPIAGEHVDTPNFDFARQGIVPIGYEQTESGFAFKASERGAS